MKDRDQIPWKETTQAEHHISVRARHDASRNLKMLIDSRERDSGNGNKYARSIFLTLRNSRAFSPYHQLTQGLTCSEGREVSSVAFWIASEFCLREDEISLAAVKEDSVRSSNTAASLCSRTSCRPDILLRILEVRYVVLTPSSTCVRARARV